MTRPFSCCPWSEVAHSEQFAAFDPGALVGAQVVRTDVTDSAVRASAGDL
jgi:hypothetical protein